MKKRKVKNNQLENVINTLAEIDHLLMMSYYENELRDLMWWSNNKDKSKRVVLLVTIFYKRPSKDRKCIQMLVSLLFGLIKGEHRLSNV